MPSLILLRGLPGAGKTALAKVFSEDGKYPLISTDDYFTGPKGEYRFKFDKNHLAYEQCEEKTLVEMKRGVEKIFVHNCFALEWEMAPYFKMAGENNYKVFVLTVENRHGSKNIHNITGDQLKKMAEKYKTVLM